MATKVPPCLSADRNKRGGTQAYGLMGVFAVLQVEIDPKMIKKLGKLLESNNDSLKMLI